jgi:cob(I)alamin adenosyltransferase
MTTTPPVHAPPRAHRRASSLVLVNTGDGKGKTTSAMGTAMRAVSTGWRVCVIQFMKSGRWKVGEEKAGRDLGMEWWSLGDGFTWESKDMGETQAKALAAWAAAEEKIASGDYRLIVLDEVTYPIVYGWLDEDRVLEAVRARPDHVNLVLTGRNAPPGLVEIADTVTEMRNQKHAFDRGIKAMKGIDF